MGLNLRDARVEDAEACGRICYDAFTAINAEHNFPPDFPNVGLATFVLRGMIEHPRCHVVVAERDGAIAGSCGIDERDEVGGIGPITVDPAGQNAGVGRTLMEAILARCADRGVDARLVQAAFHNRSMSLYTKLGFDAREPLSCLQGPAIAATPDGFTVRAATADDADACERVCRAVHGLSRRGELADAIRDGHATVVLRDGRIRGYATGIAFFAHAVAETNGDLAALIASAPAFPGPGFLLPTRNAELLRWCLARGLRIVQPMTLMTRGVYQEPRGAFLPSIAY
jgi:GNAT superfamily N-acetyltransferase